MGHQLIGIAGAGRDRLQQQINHLIGEVGRWDALLTIEQIHDSGDVEWAILLLLQFVTQSA